MKDYQEDMTIPEIKKEINLELKRLDWVKFQEENGRASGNKKVKVQLQDKKEAVNLNLNKLRKMLKEKLNA